MTASDPDLRREHPHYWVQLDYAERVRAKRGEWRPALESLLRRMRLQVSTLGVVIPLSLLYLALGAVQPAPAGWEPVVDALRLLTAVLVPTLAVLLVVHLRRLRREVRSLDELLRGA